MIFCEGIPSFFEPCRLSLSVKVQVLFSTSSYSLEFLSVIVGVSGGLKFTSSSGFMIAAADLLFPQSRAAQRSPLVIFALA